MINIQIIETIKELSPSERLALIEFTVSLLKKDMNNSKSETKTNDYSFTTLASEIAAMGEEAVANGAPVLPSDFASHHDTYLYGTTK